MPTPIKRPTGELGNLLSFDTIPSLIMERMTDIRNLAVEIRSLKIFCDPSTASVEDRQATIDSLTFKEGDHPLVQVIKQTAHMFYECRSDPIRRELLSELRELLAEQHKREIEAMREANKLLVEWAKIKQKNATAGANFEDSLMEALKAVDVQ